MKSHQLDSVIAKREGKKLQVGIGNIREIRGILSDIIFAEATPIMGCGNSVYAIKSPTVIELYKNGKRRAEDRAAARAKRRKKK